MAEKKTHARFSPSKLEELEECPRFERKPDDPDAKRDSAADEGTRLHHAFETGDLSGLDEEQKAVAEMAIGYRDSVIASIPTLLQDEREAYLEIPGLTFGYADQVLIGMDADGQVFGDVMDAKFGRKGATKAEENFQIHCYASALFIRQELRGQPLAYVRGHIVAPRTQQTPYGVKYGPTLVGETRLRIERLYEKLHNPFTAPVANDDLCAMCRWVAQCPAMHRTASLMAKGMGLPTPAVFAPDAIVTTRDRAIAQVLVKALENWAEQVSDNNTEYVKKGGEIPGFKLITRSTGSRIPTEMTGAAIMRLTNQGYTMDRLVPGLRVSIPELAKSECELHGSSEEEERKVILDVVGDAAVAGSASYLQKVKKFDFSSLLALPEPAGAQNKGGAEVHESIAELPAR